MRSKIKRNLPRFCDKYSSFLQNVMSIPNHFTYGYQLKILTSETLQIHEINKLKIAEFDIPFVNSGNASLSSLTLFRFITDKPEANLFLMDEESQIFSEENFLTFNISSKVTSTATFEDFLLFISPWNDYFSNYHNFVSRLLYKVNFDIIAHQPQNDKSVLRFCIYVQSSEVYEAFDSSLFNCKNSNRFLTLFFTGLNNHYFAQIIDRNDQISLTEIYKGIYEKQLEKNLPLLTLKKPDKLIPDLRPYQISAVQWMMHRELRSEPKDHQILFIEFTFPHDRKMFVHQVFGSIITPKAFQHYLNNFPVSNGGILADEMGLGKTVEMIALILQNPSINTIFYPFAEPETIFNNRQNICISSLVCLCGKNESGPIDKTPIEKILNDSLNFGYYCFEHDSLGELIKCLHCGTYQHSYCQHYEKYKGEFPYLCNRCWLKVKNIESSSTLIICPKSILEQWFEEIKKHAPEIDVIIYKGMKASINSGTSGMIFPQLLAKKDIVLSTYDVLSKEINYVQQYDQTRLRHTKRFMPPCTPLLSINWHRFCLDEAQMIGFSRAFEMAKSLRSKYCWAISGTPIEKCASEMKNLFSFINEEPFRNQILTERVISLDSQSSEERRQFFFDSISNCLWRTPKEMVIDEIGLKPPIFHTEYLQMSQIERDFYQNILGAMKKSRLTACEQNAKQADINNFLYQFSRLRKICCCPSVVGKFLTTSGKQKKTLTVEERLKKLWKSMLKNTKNNAVCALRAWVSAMNCASALWIQDRKFVDAIENYRKTLSFVEENQDNFKTDSIQLFHIYYNCARILILYGCDQIDEAGRSLSDTLEGFLIDDIAFDKNLDILQDDRFCALKASRLSDRYIFESQQSLFKTYDDICKSHDPMAIAKQSKTELKWFIAAIRICEQKNDDFFQVIQPDVSTIQNSISTSGLLIFKANDLLLKLKEGYDSIMTLFDTFFTHDLEGIDFYRYYNCHIKRTGEIELCLLCVITEKITELRLLMGVYDFTDWRKSTIFTMLLKLAAYWTNNCCHYDEYDYIVEESKVFLNYLEAFNADLRFFRSLIPAFMDLINRFDELRQAKSLLKIENDEEFSIRSLDALMEQIQALGIFEHARHHYNYIENLLINSQEKTDICCICLENFEEFVILPCGHFNCCDCFKQLTNGQQITITCCICRAKTDKKNVYYADKKNVQEPQQTVIGHSTKFKNITIRLQEIIRRKEKVLVFSSWPNMLKDLQAGLDENLIISKLITSINKFGEQLEIFRKSDGCNILLLPINLAAKGLNLVEANHVLFVDTPINISEELQAIGRIHRIGQMKQTFVHKFIMSNTVEDVLNNRIANLEQSAMKNFNPNEFFLDLAGSFLDE